VNAQIVTSFTISDGVRDASGVWTPDQARKLLAFTRTLGGSIAAAEFFNEPTVAAMGGAPKGYDAAAYGRDFRIFLPFAKKVAPEMLILGPGSIGEAAQMGEGVMSAIKTEDMLTATGRGVDAFSYHFYGATSKRCAPMGAIQTTPEAALSQDWLSRTDRDEAFYAASATVLNPANRSGSPKPLRQLAAPTHGPRVSSITSAIWTSLAGWPNAASRWWRTIRWPQAIMA
jgi:hypothetical protein